MDCSTLPAFRAGLYGCFGSGKDALMNLSDALLSEPTARSVAELSLAPCFVRRWPSVYQALADGQIEQAALRRLLSAFAPFASKGDRLVLGLDTSDIARPFSETARDRLGLPVANLPPKAKASTCGWRFSSLVVLPTPTSSWVYPLDNQRVPTTQTPAQVGAEQLQEIVPLLPETPLLLGDRHYGSAAFLEQTASVACDKLIRLQSHRVFYRPAPPKTGQRGQPRKDGDRFQCKDTTTHGQADAAWSAEDTKGRLVEVACWHHLHFRACRTVEVSVVRVIRHGAQGTKRDPKVSWFLWHSPKKQEPDLAHVVETYRLRYGHEHGFRFAKQDLLWTKPRLRTPEAFQTWTDLLSAVQAQLHLARSFAQSERRPWESKTRPSSPQQVRRAMGRILPRLGTPARPSQLRGYSPGRASGTLVKKAPRFPVVVKAKPKTTKHKPEQTQIV
jgi:hypothetical protein